MSISVIHDKNLGVRRHSHSNRTYNGYLRWVSLRNRRQAGWEGSQ